MVHAEKDMFVNLQLISSSQVFALCDNSNLKGWSIYRKSRTLILPLTKYRMGHLNTPFAQAGGEGV